MHRQIFFFFCKSQVLKLNCVCGSWEGSSLSWDTLVNTLWSQHLCFSQHAMNHECCPSHNVNPSQNRCALPAYFANSARECRRPFTAPNYGGANLLTSKKGKGQRHCAMWWLMGWDSPPKGTPHKLLFSNVKSPNSFMDFLLVLLEFDFFT